MIHNADTLRRWRDQKGLTQVGASLYIGVPLRSYQNWETGHRPIEGPARALLDWVCLMETLAPGAAATVMRVRIEQPPGRKQPCED